MYSDQITIPIPIIYQAMKTNIVHINTKRSISTYKSQSIELNMVNINLH